MEREKERNMTKEERVNLNRKIRSAKIFAFGGVMLAMCVVGLLLFMRPDTSVLEKRELTAFPAFDAAAFWDGRYFKDIDTWYADTYPLREHMIAASQKMESLYGLRSEQIVDSELSEDLVADDVPDEIPEEGEGAEEAGVAAEPEEPLPDGTVHEIGEMRGKIYIAGNSGYELYYFVEENNRNYAATMNEIYERVGDKVNLYVLIAPLSSGVMLDQSVLDDMGSSNEGEALDFIYSQMDDRIHKVNPMELMRKHNAEYLFFRTDHHWTALGAYYAYVAFCEQKGIEAHNYMDYETMEFPDFLGTFYANSRQSPELAENPDTVVAYVPKGTNDMTMTYVDGTVVDWKIINDVSSYAKTELYATFVGGDRPFSGAHNPTITDGSTVLLIKDSYGNAFLPWLVDHYEYIYWIDARYTNYTISQMVEEFGVQDVIYESSIYNCSSEKMQSRYATIGQ